MTILLSKPLAAFTFVASESVEAIRLDVSHCHVIIGVIP